ncbi:uncharacterized protein LOC119685753 [Teleopsis dalmanni]|uniref:uncharacterized protein LOC119685753 n=1 Tax=Teleopsis dalmanni TaxID=139649 RepID=UPI0018CFD83C|nr:uncharacterized protein LOC119685753 [Teleopsis dalmanni]
MPLEEDNISNKDDCNTTDKIPLRSAENEKNETSTSICSINKEPQLICKLQHFVSENSAYEQIFLCGDDLKSKTLSQMLARHIIAPSHSVSDVCMINDNRMIVKIQPEVNQTAKLRGNLERNESKTFIHIRKLLDSESKEQKLVRRNPGTCFLNMQHKVKLETLQPQNADGTSIWDHSDIFCLRTSNESDTSFICTTMRPKIRTALSNLELPLQKYIEKKAVRNTAVHSMKTQKSKDNTTKSQKNCAELNTCIIKSTTPKNVFASNVNDASDSSLEPLDSENSYTYQIGEKNNVSTFKNRKFKTKHVLKMQKNNVITKRNSNNRKLKPSILKQKRLFTGCNALKKPFMQTTSVADIETVATFRNTKDNFLNLEKNVDTINETKKLKNEEHTIASPFDTRKHKIITGKSYKKCFRRKKTVSFLSSQNSTISEEDKKDKIQKGLYVDANKNYSTTAFIEHSGKLPNTSDIPRLQVEQNDDSHKPIQTAKMNLVNAVEHSNSTLKKEIAIDDRKISMSSESNQRKFIDYERYDCTNKSQNTLSMDKLKSALSEREVSSRWTKRSSTSISELQEFTPIITNTSQKMRYAEDKNNTADTTSPITSTSDKTNNVIILENKTIKDRCLAWEKKLGVISTSLSRNSRAVFLNTNTCFDKSTLPVQEVKSFKSKICKTDSALICCGLQQENKNIYLENQLSLITADANKSLQESKETNNISTEVLGSAYIEFRPNVQSNSRYGKQEKQITEYNNEVVINKCGSDSKKKFRNEKIKKNEVVDERFESSKIMNTNESVNIVNTFNKNNLNTDIFSSANLTYTSVKDHNNLDSKAQTEQRDTFDLSPKHLKMGPKIRARCLQWEERIRLANSSITNGIKTHDSITKTHSNSRHYKVDSENNCNKLMKKLIVDVDVNKSTSPSLLETNKMVHSDAKPKESIISSDLWNCNEIVNSSAMNVSDDKNNLSTQVRSQHSANETEDFNNTNNTEVPTVSSPIIEPFFNSSQSKKKEPSSRSHIKTLNEFLRIKTNRNTKTSPIPSREPVKFIPESVTLENAEKITSIAFKEFSSNSPRVRHCSRYSIFHCFRNIFHKRHKNFSRSCKKINAIINKTYFIKWVHNEVDKDDGCKHCCKKKSTISRSQSIYF